MTVKVWTADELRRMNAADRRKLRAEVSRQRASGSTPKVRELARHTLAALDKLDERNVDHRVDDARRFLHGDTDERRNTRKRAWEVAKNLHGGEGGALAAGYRPPDDAA